MNQYKGIVEIEILGQKRGFKFGTMQAALFCKSLNCKINDMVKLLDGSDLEAQITWYWAAAVAYARLFKQDEPSKDDVAAWIDTYGFDKMESHAIEGSSTPNLETPPNQEGAK
jgi:hypothetical protein